MSLPADGQLSGLCPLSHQEAATSVAWVRPSLKGEKKQWSLNALQKKEEEMEKGAEKNQTNQTIFENKTLKEKKFAPD